MESFSRPPRSGSRTCADPEASWGHRNSNLPGPKGEMFFGYYLSAATMTRGEDGPPVPELTRRITLSSCHADPVRALTPVLARMPGNGIPLGDILADSGYAHRDADAWALPLRAAGAQLVQDLHPHDRGPQGTIHGAIIANGCLYCPATPQPLLHLGPLAPAATPEDIAAHDQQTAELARHKLGRLTADDADGYHRVTCPAAAGKLRCPLRPGLDDPGPVPARDPHPAAAPAGLLHPADPHHPTRRRGEDPAETRLPLGGAPPLLRPPHHRRTGLLHHQGPSHQQHQPRLVPPHGPDPARALAHRPARHPQPAHPHRLGHPPGREQPPRRRRATAQDPQTPPENHPRPASPRHPDQACTPRHRPPLTSTPPASPHAQTQAKPASTPQPAAMHKKTKTSSGHAASTEMSEPNVNMVPTET